MSAVSMWRGGTSSWGEITALVSGEDMGVVTPRMVVLDLKWV
jgi:hypothetical protein